MNHRTAAVVIALLAAGAQLVVEPSAGAETATTAPVTLSIAEVIGRVQAFHPQIRKAAALRLNAEVGARRARWDRVIGAVGAVAGYTGQAQGLATDASVTPPGPAWSDGFGGQVYALFRLPVYAGGAVAGAIEAASARASAAHEDLTLTGEELKRVALVAYAAASGATLRIAVAESAKERASQIVEVTETRLESGVGSRADVARSRLAALRREEELAERRGDLAVALATLRAALVLDDDVPVTLTDPLEAIAGYRGNGTVERPEILGGMARVRASDADAVVARSGYLPRVEVVASGAYGAGNVETTSPSPALALTTLVTPGAERFPGLSGTFVAGVVGTWTGFDLFVVRDRIEQAERAADAARADLADAERVVRQKVAEARASEERARSRALALTRGQSVAKEAIELARGRFETGNAILTEVIDAEMDGVALEAQMADAAYELAVTHIERLRAEGTVL